MAPKAHVPRSTARKDLYQISEGGTVILMQEFNIIIVQASSGSTLFILKVEASQSIYHVKLLIAVKENINWHCIRLGVGTTVMEDNKCVLNYRLKADSRVWLAMVDDSEASSPSDIEGHTPPPSLVGFRPQDATNRGTLQYLDGPTTTGGANQNVSPSRKKQKHRGSAQYGKLATSIEEPVGGNEQSDEHQKEQG